MIHSELKGTVCAECGGLNGHHKDGCSQRQRPTRVYMTMAMTKTESSPLSKAAYDYFQSSDEITYTDVATKFGVSKKYAQTLIEQFSSARMLRMTELRRRQKQ